MHITKLPNKVQRGWLTVCVLLVFGVLYSISSAFAQAADAVCAEVKIVIEQKLSLERQAFDAKMVITNGLADQKLENVSIELKFLDANNNVVTATVDPNAQGATFFYRTDQVTGISNLNGGVIEPKAVANINWLIIPAAGSGGRTPGFCRSKGLRLKSACVARLFKRPVSRTGWQRTRLCLVGSTALF